MADYQLTATDNPLFATTPTEVLATTVKYDAPQRIFLWRRVSSAVTWVKEDLTLGATSSQQFADLEKHGKRKTPGLKAGQFVEYGILTDEELDPNDKGFSTGRFLAYLLIDVLHTPTTLVEPNPDSGLFPGGTFVRKQVHTGVKTRLRMKVGREPAVGPPNGFRILPNPSPTSRAPASRHPTTSRPARSSPGPTTSPGPCSFLKRGSSRSSRRTSRRSGARLRSSSRSSRS
jgi:hypothetical protein